MINKRENDSLKQMNYVDAFEALRLREAISSGAQRWFSRVSHLSLFDCDDAQTTDQVDTLALPVIKAIKCNVLICIVLVYGANSASWAVNVLASRV
jgi:hypothetical protein